MNLTVFITTGMQKVNQDSSLMVRKLVGSITGLKLNQFHLKTGDSIQEMETGLTKRVKIGLVTNQISQATQHQLLQIMLKISHWLSKTGNSIQEPIPGLIHKAEIGQDTSQISQDSPLETDMVKSEIFQLRDYLSRTGNNIQVTETGSTKKAEIGLVMSQISQDTLLVT